MIIPPSFFSFSFVDLASFFTVLLSICFFFTVLCFFLFHLRKAR